MSLYAIGDLHLCLGAYKPMDVFGGRWEGYMDKLREGLSVIQSGDTTVLLGDLSWALGIEQAEKDFAFIHEIPGRKIILKGNHDYWWTTAAKFYKFCAAHGWDDMFILNNNCYYYGDIALCGTRGWFYEQEQEGTHDEKIFRRELGRLEASLKAAGEHEKLCFLHYPPIYQGYKCPEMLELLDKYEVERCYYGHLHGYTHRRAFEGMREKTEYALIAADYVAFQPVKICN